MPGDVRACDIAFVNAATDCDFAVLTLTAEPHGAENPLSESVAAVGETVESAKDFLNRMTLTVTSGGQTLYDGPAGSDAMFGTGVALGTVRTGEQIGLHVVLSVPKEMDNDYASRAGEIDWVFHVETYNESQIIVRKVWSEGQRLARKRQREGQPPARRANRPHRGIERRQPVDLYLRAAG